MRGIMSSAGSLSEILDLKDIDIAFLTEHKLLPQSTSFCDTIHKDYIAYTEADQTVT